MSSTYNRLLIIVLLVLLVFFVAWNLFSTNHVEGISNMDDDNIGTEISVLYGQITDLMYLLQELIVSITYYGDPSDDKFNEISMQLSQNYNFLVGFQQKAMDVSTHEYLTNIKRVHQQKQESLKTYQNNVASAYDRKEAELSNNHEAYLKQQQKIEDEYGTCISDMIDRMSPDQNYSMLNFSVCNSKYNMKMSKYDTIYNQKNVDNIMKLYNQKLATYTEVYDKSMAHYNSLVSSTVYVEELLPMMNQMRMHLQFFLGGKIDDNDAVEGFIKTYVVPYLKSSGLDSLIEDNINKSHLVNHELTKAPRLPQPILDDLMSLKKSSTSPTPTTVMNAKDTQIQLLTKFLSDYIL